MKSPFRNLFFVGIAVALSLSVASECLAKACTKVPDGQQTVSYAAKYLALEVGPLFKHEGKWFSTLDFRPRNNACIARVDLDGRKFKDSTRRCDETKWTKNLVDDMRPVATKDFSPTSSDLRPQSFAAEAPFVSILGFTSDSNFGTNGSYDVWVFFKECSNCQTGLQIVYMCV